MTWLFCISVIILLTIIILLFIKIYSLKHAVCEIGEAFAECISTDSNTLIRLSTRDKYIQKLVLAINEQLRLLRCQRQKYLNGDRELKEAITNISHDLRTPLTVICGYLDLLEQEEKSEAVSRYLSYIENRTQTLKQLTEELFRYSVIISTNETIQTELLSLNGILEESIATFYAVLTEHGITPVIQLPHKQVVCQGNKAALSRVFSNILNNALKYSDGDLEIYMSDTGQIIFTNTASKLDLVQVEKLFDRFFSVESSRNSTGLGLSISKTLLEQMKGSISAKYQHNQLSIYIQLPVNHL